MDQIRMLAAIVLSLLVFLIWQMFFVDNKAVKQDTAEENVIKAVDLPAENVPSTEIIGHQDICVAKDCSSCSRPSV